MFFVDQLDFGEFAHDFPGHVVAFLHQNGVEIHVGSWIVDKFKHTLHCC